MAGSRDLQSTTDASSPSDRSEWLVELLRQGLADASSESVRGLARDLSRAGLVRKTADGWVPTGAFMLHRTHESEGAQGVLERLRAEGTARAVVAALALAHDPLPPGNPTVFFDCGSSFIPLVQLMLDGLAGSDVHQLSIVTASLPIAMEVLIHRNQEMVDLHVVGGPVVRRHCCTAPEQGGAIDAGLSRTVQRVDIAYIGAASVDLQSGRLQSDNTDTHVSKRWAVEHARRVAVLVSAAKVRPAGRHENAYALMSKAADGRFELRSTNPESARAPVTIFADRMTAADRAAPFGASVVTPEESP